MKPLVVLIWGGLLAIGAAAQTRPAYQTASGAVISNADETPAPYVPDDHLEYAADVSARANEAAALARIRAAAPHVEIHQAPAYFPGIRIRATPRPAARGTRRR